jgi:chitinase
MPRIASLIYAALCAAALAAPAICQARSGMPSPAIVAYVFPQNNALQPGQIDVNSLTRINYAFANIENGRIVTGFADDKQNFAFLDSLKQQNPSLTVLVSVGGWLWSTNFSDVSLTPQSRAIFIQSVMDFLKQYDLDGLDIDWEYPGMIGSGHPFRPEDKQNFTSLIKELRARFNDETGKTQKKLYLTIAAGASDDFLAHTEMAKVQRYLDTVNLMAYDYYEPDSDAIAGHHAPLYTNPADPKKVSADASVQAFEKAGVPPNKILLGLPFYGHVWGQVANSNHGLYQPGKQIPNAYASYQAITGSMLNQGLSQGYDRYWDSAASVPYLYNPEKQIFVSYEDPQSVVAKCNYVLSRKLGGVMFWDYESDPSGALLGAIHRSLTTDAKKGSSTK